MKYSVSLGCAVTVFALVGCHTPTPSLRLELSGDGGQACPSTDCEQVGLPCRAAMSIRIIDPSDRAAIYLDQCREVPFDHNRTMCSLASVELDSTALPVRDLEVQVAVFPMTMVSAKAGALSCPTVRFGGNGLPIEQFPSPALGGQAFYHPGDSSVVVRLGCTDLSVLAESCAVPSSVQASASVIDFENMFPVPVGPVANQLRVTVGEPRLVDGRFQFTAEESRPLTPARAEDEDEDTSTATWLGNIDLAFEKYACVEVLETVAQTTATLRCAELRPDGTLDDLRGVRIASDVLQEVLGSTASLAPSLIEVPREGITVGIVVDPASNPLEGMVVRSASAIKYLSKDGVLVDDGATSKRGVFVSTSAPFGTLFSTSGGSRGEISALGGRVEGRVTVVVLQYGGPSL